ncbi:MAG: hypothetical protein ACOYKA_04010 [Legionellaceae bacterium]
MTKERFLKRAVGSFLDLRPMIVDARDFAHLPPEIKKIQFSPHRDLGWVDVKYLALALEKTPKTVELIDISHVKLFGHDLAYNKKILDVIALYPQRIVINEAYLEYFLWVNQIELPNKEDPDFKVIKALVDEFTDLGLDCFQGNMRPELLLLKCHHAILHAKSKLEDNKSRWDTLSPLLKKILGVAALVTLLPALAVKIGSKRGYVGTFFIEPTHQSAFIALNKSDAFIEKKAPFFQVPGSE